MTERWILVANASEAALYAADATGREMHLVRRHQHTESRAKNVELTTDINGRKPGGGVGADARPGAQPRTEPKDVEHERFARFLAEEIEHGRLEHAFAKLVLCAPPHFLGLLRAALEKETIRDIEFSLDKDLTHLDERALSEAVRAASQN